MPKPNPESLDAMIDETLRSEPIRSAPLSLQRDIQRRVERLAQAQRERRQFRVRLALVVALCLAAGALAVGAAASSGLSSAVQSAVPGALGYYDYVSVQAGHWGLVLLTGAVAAIALIVVAGVFAETRAHRRVVSAAS